MTSETKVDGIVYALICDIDKMFYIGSTTVGIAKRLSIHKESSISPQYRHRKVYKHMNATGRNNWSIRALATLPNTTKFQLEELEFKFIHQCLLDDNKKAKLLNTMFRKNIYSDAVKQSKKKYSIQKVICDNCGTQSTKKSISGHKRSNKCKNFQRN
jgi:hypothetical protein